VNAAFWRALSNMEFNFVDQRTGSYAIQTVNGAIGAKGLGLNVSTASASTGDGKKLGGPGNLIKNWQAKTSKNRQNNLAFARARVSQSPDE
jgi:hypothetical protein